MKLIKTENLKIVKYTIEHPVHGELILEDFYAEGKDKVIDSRIYDKSGNEIAADHPTIADVEQLLDEVQEFIDKL